MEKFKFMLQVFIAIVALPVLSVVELNHNKKDEQVNNKIVTEKIALKAEGYYLNNTRKPARLYVK